MLPVLFIGYYGSVTLFMHVHIEEGTAILHAHPFAKSEDGTCHEHATPDEIHLFHILSSIAAQDGVVKTFLLSFYDAPLRLLSEPLIHAQLSGSAVGIVTLRAPPAFA